MSNKKYPRFGTAFVLTAEVEKYDVAPSGYRLVNVQRTTGAQLYAHERFAGVAALTRLGIVAELCIVGGDEDRYPGSGITRPAISKIILEREMGAVGEITTIETGPHTVTRDSARRVRDRIGGMNGAHMLVTSWYHALRARQLFEDEGAWLETYPAEAFLILEGRIGKQDLIARFGGGAFARRCVDECHYYVDKLRGQDNSIRT